MTLDKKIIPFLRKKDFQLIKELDRGACGKTVLLYDEIINEYFVCKKYEPIYESLKEVFFKNFLQEIKLLHLVYHRNVVRVFNYYMYPNSTTGFVVMEYVQGFDILEYLTKTPENFNEVFFQTIEGFEHLEQNNILHRDIREKNIMVTTEGVVKIIDFGFGKEVEVKGDFDKSISLNWWCKTPDEFTNKIYDFRTEVYFVGKLFEKILIEKEVESFKYKALLGKMCQANPDNRISSFSEIKKEILSDKFEEVEFSYEELEVYRNFSGALFSLLSHIESGAKYFDDIDFVQMKLEELYKKVMLEEYLPDLPAVTRCFIDGAYSYFRKRNFYVFCIKDFIKLLRSCSKEKRNIILSNIHSRLDSVKRNDPDRSIKTGATDDEDEIPF